MKGFLPLRKPVVYPLLLVAGILMGCGIFKNQRPADAPTPTSFIAVATWTPISPAQAQILGPEVVHPRSFSVELGRAYPFRLYTHCGPDFLTDFDGSFWQLGNPAKIPASLGNPEQVGRMTLIDMNSARFDFEGGSLLFVRHQGPKYIPGPCV